jgi:hypothetical protein
LRSIGSKSFLHPILVSNPGPGEADMCF